MANTVGPRSPEMRFRIRSVARWTVPLGVAVLLTLVSGSGAPARAEEPGAGGPAEEQVAPPVRASSRDVPKLESALQRLAGLSRQDTQLVPQFAEASDLTVRNGEVVVVVQASPDRLPYVVDQVSLLGGRVLRSQGELAKVSLPIDRELYT